MNAIWRLLVSGLLLGGTVIWVPAMATAAATPGGATDPALRGPLNQDNDEDNNQDNNEDDNSEDDNNDGVDNGNANDNNDGVDNGNGNTNGNANDNDTASDNGNTNGNANDNDAPPPPPAAPNPGTPTDPNNSGAQVTNGELVVDLWRSTDYPVANTPFQLGVTGSGAPIERVTIWADAPAGATAGPAGDDFALAGQYYRDCGGVTPCDQSWQFVARNVGFYTIHARVRDTSGREVQTDWHILFSSNPR